MLLYPDRTLDEAEREKRHRLMAEVNKYREHAWSASLPGYKNARRCELVDREIDGILTPEEATELQVLQEQFFQERRRLAPIPLSDLRELHQTLLAKAQKAAGRDA